jgi:hypothetical protein
MLLHQVINFFSFGFQHCLERVLDVEGVVALLAHLYH